ncbi:LysE family translocator [Leifsonia sp. ZF2019]|uniref:LysE family translocator n=1 Tax=Leifsonia sp. ZF2019 TaxID=2781978 RepID=UPI001CBE776D|nr:LysE family translocator [Leifsonia sp. ZF2019]UAJ78847.1 LysE family translocator [Leifsonia sp. ZF2019]
MIDVAVLPLFLLASLLICLAPGTDMAYMLAVGIRGGRTAALRASAGVALGVLVYSLAVAAGAGTLVRELPWSLNLLRLIGFGYLAWLAVEAFREARRGADVGSGGRDGAWFRQGLVVNLTNPKMALFFLAFLPQFLGSAESSAAQFVLLGLCFMAIGYVVDTTVGLLAGVLQRRLAPGSSAARMLSVLAGIVYTCLAGVVGWELVASLAEH